jgi:hypothetical protein
MYGVTVANPIAGRRSWLYLGDVIALLTFLGYHVLPDSLDYRPKFMIESKRKIYYQIYMVHMSMVSLTGRPPLMSHRYSTTPLPVDIGNDALFRDKEDVLAGSADDIDTAGWDKQWRKFAVAPMRTRAKLMLLREEIMGFALNAKRQAPVEALLYVARNPKFPKSQLAYKRTLR